MADPQTLCSIRLKYEIWPVGPKFDTDSRGLSPKATGLHLTGVGGDTLGSTLALLTSWAKFLHVAQYCSTVLLLYCATALLLYCQVHKISLLLYCATALLPTSHFSR